MTTLNALISKIIQKNTVDGEFPSHDKIVKILERDYADAVDKYLKSHRRNLLGGAVTRQLAFQRNNLRKSNLARRILDGTSAAVFDVDKFWNTPFFIQGEGWKVLGSLTGKDHEVIADKYELGAVAMGSRAEFHRELAIQVGNRTTREVYDPKKLLKQISGAYDTAAITGGN